MELLIDQIEQHKVLLFSVIANVMWILYHFYEINRKSQLIQILDKENDDLLTALIKERAKNV